MLNEVRKWMGQILELLLWLISVLVLLQILFGSDVSEFFGIDVINNLGNLAETFGKAGLIGVIAASIVAYYIIKYRVSSDPEENQGNSENTSPPS